MQRDSQNVNERSIYTHLAMSLYRFHKAYKKTPFKFWVLNKDTQNIFF